ncbi:MAG: dockerin type I domain-containing protein, partial [Planctomycetota bacterium]|nr:dockerin type I domain-containing protein [Planctomycetota bacterium]
VTVTTNDDDVAGFTLSKATATVTEPNTTDTFTVVLTRQPLTDVVFSVTSGDTGEVTVSPSTVTFTSANWNTAQTVTLTAADDMTVDGPQTSTVTVSVVDASSDNAWDPLADKTVTVTTNDDDPPTVSSVTPNLNTITDANAGLGMFMLTVAFSEPMDASTAPTISFPVENTGSTLTLNAGQSSWKNNTTYVAKYNVTDANTTLANVDVRVTGGKDVAGNAQSPASFSDQFSIDTQNPAVTVNQASSQGDPTNVSPINFTVVFSEAVSDFAPPPPPGVWPVTLSGTAGAMTATVTGTGTMYNVAVSGMTVTGTVIVSLKAGVVHDAAGNGNTASTGTNNYVWYAPWNHSFQPCDVNGDGVVTPLDVLVIINYINAHPDVVGLPNPPDAVMPPPYYDVNADGVCTPLDVLVVINYINAHSGGSAEGEMLVEVSPSMLAQTRLADVPAGTATSRWMPSDSGSTFDYGPMCRSYAIPAPTITGGATGDALTQTVRLQRRSVPHVRDVDVADSLSSPATDMEAVLNDIAVDVDRVWNGVLGSGSDLEFRA